MTFRHYVFWMSVAAFVMCMILDFRQYVIWTSIAVIALCIITALWDD